jgi:TP901 family phage tail tape measure protein
MGSRISTRVVADTNDFTSKLKKAGGIANNFGISLIAVGTIAAAVGVKAVRMSADFETALTKMNTLAGASKKEIAGFREEILKLSKETGRGPQELAEALYFISSSGLQGKEAMEALTSSAQAARIGMGDTIVVADALTVILNAYGKEAISSAEATDLMWRSIRAGKAEANEFAGSLGTVIPFAAELGVKFEEVATAMAVLTRVLDTDLAATALKNMFAVVLKDSPKMVEALGKLGKTQAELASDIRSNGALPTMIKLAEAMKEHGVIVGEMFPDMRSLLGFLSLTGEKAGIVTEVTKEMTNKMIDFNTSIEDTSDTLNDKLNIKLAALDVLLIQVGESLTRFALDDGAEIRFSELNWMIAAQIAAWKALKKAKEAFTDLPSFFDEGEIISDPRAGSAAITRLREESAKRVQLAKEEAAKAEALKLAEAAKALAAKEKAEKDAIDRLAEYNRKNKFDGLATNKRVGNSIPGDELITADKGPMTGVIEDYNMELEKAVDTSEKLAKPVRDFADIWKNDVIPALEFASQSLGRLTSIHAMSMQNQMAAIDAKQAKEREAMEESGASRDELAELDKKHKKEKTKAEAKAAEQNKMLGIANAAVNTAVAVTASLPNLVLAGIVGALGAAEIAVIASTPIPSFAVGTTSFRGGQAILHPGETLSNLPEGTKIKSKGMSRMDDGLNGKVLLSKIQGDEFVVFLADQQRKYGSR